MKKHISFIIVVALFAAILVLSGCSNQKAAPSSKNPATEKQTTGIVQQPIQNSEPNGIQITSQEEADGIDQAIAELEETDAP